MVTNVIFMITLILTYLPVYIITPALLPSLMCYRNRIEGLKRVGEAYPGWIMGGGGGN